VTVAAPVVIKVGGSLLDWPGLPARLAEVLAGQTRPVVLIVGGGRAADWVRDLDRWHGLGEEPAHALALHALDLTAHLLAALVPGLEVVPGIDVLGAVWRSDRLPILAPRTFLEEEDRLAPDPLPRSWAVTSDSIAARVAVRLDAEELLLLKSAPLPPGTGRAEAARLGLVDPTFPAVARGLGCVLYLNLRHPAAITQPLKGGSR
jgi:aspartokinase-like uncharacterized kinase